MFQFDTCQFFLLPQSGPCLVSWEQSHCYPSCSIEQYTTKHVHCLYIVTRAQTEALLEHVRWLNSVKE